MIEVTKRDAEQAWQVVEDAKRAYLKAANARKPSATLWNDYAAKLHTYRLFMRNWKSNG